ncbi:hypothetical protein Cni_G26983 [Canna indica]|uniref:RING-type domain-containing protein n=1 Tax=Canna indica TaxID=4628 RepID=A0AAQ3L0P1_9LILI|nr:hypothetical protein Cni_G26983 [Canna indica]
MRYPARFLESSDPLRPADPPAPLPFDSDVVIILAALLCALICVVGLALVARCACLRRSASSSSYPAPPNKGLKKKAVQALPTVSFDSSSAASAADAAAAPGTEAAGGVKLVECAICIAEFADGDVVRVLPQCGHGFHAECVDTWLRSHSTCPSCRRILVVPAPPRSQESGGGSSAAKDSDGRGQASTYLP